MPFQPVPDTIQVESVWNYMGQTVENVYHFHTEVVVDLAVLTQVGNIVKDWENNIMKSSRSTVAQLIKLVVKDLSTEGGAGIEISPNPAIVGTRNSPGQPGNVTFSVKWITGLTGRAHRGRTYHIGTTVDQCAGNLLVELVRQGEITAYGALIASAVAAGFPMVVVSRYHGKLPNGKPAPRPVGLTSVINACTIDADLDSQRRRLTGRGQ